MWRRIISSAGTVRITELVEDSGWSHRRLITRLRDYVGLSPKAAASVIRFERALYEVSYGGGLAGLADRRGYADQSHLTRDFARYAGDSPASLRRRTVPTAWTTLGRRPG